MPCPSNYSTGDILALDRACINYAKFEELTGRDVVYVTKMKKSLVYQTEKDTMYMDVNGQLALQQEQTQAGLAADQRHGNGGWTDNRDIPQEVADRASVQAAEAKLPAALFLRRERQRHQDTDLGHAYCQPAADGHSEAHQAPMELLRTGDHGAHHARVLINCHTFLEESEKDWAKILQDNGSLAPDLELSLFE